MLLLVVLGFRDPGGCGPRQLAGYCHGGEAWENTERKIVNAR